MESGDITGVILGGVHRGECGKPGELTGILTDEDLGDLTKNCECGVFGILDREDIKSTNILPVGAKGDVHEGEATIISTIKNGKTARYNVEIYDIDLNSQGSKSFRIRVTDETLKAMTGGIVRGMSGSPIIQNGKLVGAVTHVLIGDPTEGYGIFIENMLNAAQMPMAKAS
jgi:stage IV sporulation protein B